MKKSSKSNRKAKKGAKTDGVDIIFRLQKMMALDQIRCLEDFVKSFQASSSEAMPPFQYQCEMTTTTRSLAYRFRLYPGQDQEVLLAKHFGCVRWVYNYFLAERIRQYEERGKTDKYPAQSKSLTRIKKDKEWLREVYSQALQQALRNLENAFENFYEGRAGFPKFHSKYARNSFCVPQNAKVEDGRLWLPKFKSGIPITMHRPIQGEIGMVTITRTASGEYYASFCVTEQRRELQPVARAVGLDLGIKDLGVTSDGQKFENLKHFKKYQRQLARAQKHLSRKKKGSRGYRKQKIKVARIHEKIANCRKDYLHKLTLELVRNYGVICIEDLNVRGLIKNHNLSKWIADASWGTFVTMLKYKADWYGRIVVQVDRFYPSTQTCSCCGEINKATKDLKIRQWDCPKCGAHHDRDVNSGSNLLKSGLEKLWRQVEKTRQTGKA